jgi:hypothetical protein
MYNDLLAKILEPDTMLPFHFYGTRQLSGQMDGQKKLMLAVLQDAVECLEKYRSPKSVIQQELYQDALNWIRDPSSDWLFCFASVCDFLGFDPAYLRQSLLEREEKACEKTRTTKLADLAGSARSCKLPAAFS